MYSELIRLQLTLSASQTLTVLSNEEVASRGRFGLKRTSVIIAVCSSRVVLGFIVSVCHITACKNGIKPRCYLSFRNRNKTSMMIPGFYLFVMSGTSKHFAIQWEVATGDFACARTYWVHFRKRETCWRGIIEKYCWIMLSGGYKHTPLLTSIHRPTVSRWSPSSWDKKDSTLSSSDPSSTNRSISACKTANSWWY